MKHQMPSYCDSTGHLFYLKMEYKQFSGIKLGYL